MAETLADAETDAYAETDADAGKPMQTWTGERLRKTDKHELHINPVKTADAGALADVEADAENEPDANTGCS